ncbi:MAG: immunoglobulin domain-containing protein, partial [Limisphaerales bacterium]
MGFPLGFRLTRFVGFALVFTLLVNVARADLLPFPLSAGQRGDVTCLEHPEIAYDVYLPPGYPTNGSPLPIFFSFSSTGGGMNTSFLSALMQSNIIGIGIIGSRNSAPDGTMEREGWAVFRDLRKRVLFDPTAQMAGGISGGGWSAFDFTRMQSQHISGVLEMAGWLGVNPGSPYPSTKREQTNLFVAWTAGDQDGAGGLYPYDSNYLATVCGDTLNFWSFSGGHVAPPTAVQLECFAWMLTNRVPAGVTDRMDSEAQLAGWRTRLGKGDLENVLRECVSVLMNRPRTWFALQAQIVLDEMEGDYEAFRTININDIAQGDYAQDMFYYSAYGAAYASDPVHYHSSLRGVTGVTGSSGDQSANIHSLLLKFGWPTPRARWSFDPLQNFVTLFTYKDAPGLTYVLQSRTNLLADIWTTRGEVPLDTNTLWATTVNHDNGSPVEFYRLKAQIVYTSDQVPTISSVPQSQTAYIGTSTTLKVTASGTGPFGYQWRKDGLDLSDMGNVSGSETSILTLRNLSQADAGSYEVAVMGFTSVTSSPPAVLTVLPFDVSQLPTITSQPQSRTNYAGVTVTFGVTASGTGPFGYQ